MRCVLCGLQMVAALTGQFNHLVERVIVIDCRYPYEFEGGHIKVSKNCVFKFKNSYFWTNIVHFLQMY